MKTPALDNRDLVISDNDCGFFCTLCDAPVAPRQGPELFLDGEGHVCWDCGRRYAPDLVAKLEAHYRGRGGA